MAQLSRRGFLQIGAVAGGVVALRHVIQNVPLASASPTEPQLLLAVYFNGGWDVLLGLDPRDNTQAAFSKTEAYKPGGSGIYPAYDIVDDPQVKSLLATNPSGVQKAGNLTFGPAVPASLLAHAPDLCVARGIAMATLTHEVGRRYFTTGKFPRGLAANGPAITSVVAASDGGSVLLPNMAVSTESYNEGLPPSSSPIRVVTSADVLAALKPFGTALSSGSAAALEAFEAAPTCEQQVMDRDGLVALLRDNKKKARSLATSDVATLFQFNAAAPSPQVKPIFDALGIATAADLAGPKGQAALAGQALVNGVSQAVSVQLATGLDDHFDWDVDHSNTLRLGFDTLARLISYLKATEYKGTGKSVWSKTTLMVFSEFCRTPLVNGRNGRDHHLANSALFAGPGIKGNTVIGATTDVQFAARNIDLTTGKPADGGVALRPADLHATVLKSMGVAYTNLNNQSPNIVSAMLK